MNAPVETLVHAPAQRPAETGGVAGAIVLLVVHLLGVTDPDVIVALAVVVGFVPAAITWLVSLWRKREGAGG